MNSAYQRTKRFLIFGHVASTVLVKGLFSVFAILAIEGYIHSEKLSVAPWIISCVAFLAAEAFFVIAPFVMTAGQKFSFWGDVSLKLARMTEEDFNKQPYSEQNLRKQQMLVVPLLCFLLALVFANVLLGFLLQAGLLEALGSTILLFMLFAILETTMALKK